MTHTHPTHAIVLGASMAGLLAASVLARHHDTVTIVERDRLGDTPTPRKGVPQGRHAHALLAGGLRAIERLLPGATADLIAGGAVKGDLIGDVKINQAGTYRPRVRSGIDLLCMTRPFLELVVRRRVLSAGNVRLLEGVAVTGFVHEDDRVVGVHLTNPAGGPSVLRAQLVVDAMGRGSRTPAWLDAAGYGRPEETRMDIGLTYVSREYRRAPGDFGGLNAFAVTPDAPRERRVGSASAVEGDRWLVMQGGWLGEHPTPDDESFLAFARALPAPDLHDFLLTAEPVSDFAVFHFPANVRRHYERMRRFPDGLVVLGDAWCAFNPVYGQGMTVAALEALALDRLLGWGRRRGRIGAAFFRASRSTIELAWSMAATADLVYPEVRGRRPALTRLTNGYMQRLQRASYVDPTLARDLFSVAHLLAAPTVLFAPGTLLRVLRASRVSSPEGARRPARSGGWH
ncbi:FAD-dependent oxidoreductase [Deinococcus pimensis]|uniref:FAD-dependent oxidoreductase n=1 Tax=Deinococcus pimensis TaxID=309888 RepID=UPI0005EB2E3D|nr:FAD-dependent monooxygenase [Deinococcus pimensis]